MRPATAMAPATARSSQGIRLRGASGVEEAEAVRLGGRLAAAGHAQLAEDVRHVDAGRLGRDEKLAGDLPVAAPGRDQAEHLELALGKPEPAEAGASVGAGITREGGTRPVPAIQPDPGAPGEDRDLLAERSRAQPGGQRCRALQPLRRAVALTAG